MSQDSQFLLTFRILLNLPTDLSFNLFDILLHLPFHPILNHDISIDILKLICLDDV